MNSRGGMRATEMRYPKERKEAVLKKMLPPNNKPIQELAQEEGICKATLYNWRNQAPVQKAACFRRVAAPQPAGVLQTSLLPLSRPQR